MSGVSIYLLGKANGKVAVFKLPPPPEPSNGKLSSSSKSTQLLKLSSSSEKTSVLCEGAGWDGVTVGGWEDMSSINKLLISHFYEHNLTKIVCTKYPYNDILLLY